MADPITWLAIGSAALGAMGAIQQGEQANAAAQSEANMAEYNAKMNEIQARQAYAGAGRQEEEQRRRARAQIGQSLAASAEAGAGLNGDVLRTSVFDAESDALAIRYEGDLKAQGLKDSAALQKSAAVVARDRGKQAVKASYLNAASSVLNAGSGYYKGTK
jgi:hypothetical protein